MNKAKPSFEHFRGNEEFVKRIYDLIDLSQRRNRIIITPFFSPDQCHLVELICGKTQHYEKQGGYDSAERNRYAFLPYESDVTFPSIVLKANYSSTFGSLSHRDVLGALMHLGIEREKIGDIICDDNSISIILDEDIENYIICNLVKIRRTSVQFKRSNKEIAYTPSIRSLKKIVSSLRLDTIVSSLTNVSRGKAQEMILAGRVKVDHVVLEQTSYLCNNNSAISIRGYGRYHFVEVIKKTKKDHYVIDVGMYE